jgi:zinc/manganese transport system permease protein
MVDFLRFMGWPFATCLILAGIHAYLGIHVIRRQVIFVDLALAQIAALGAVMALVMGYGTESLFSYGLSLAFTVAGAAIFALTRHQKQRIPQEAVIGIVYAVSAALLILILGRFGEGDEHMREALVGNLLLVTPAEVIKIALIYAAVGALHWLLRKKFFLITERPEESFKTLNVRWWDFVFYVSFGVVVTSSVKIAGVLVVFAYLIVPSACAVLFADSMKARLAIGWLVAALVSVLGIAASYFLDLPTGPALVCVFGLTLALLAIFRKSMHSV